MGSNQTMLMENLVMFEEQHGMENYQVLQLQKFGVIGIIKEAIKILHKSPKFIFITFLTSLPLIFTMTLHEIILQRSMVDTKPLPNSPPPSDKFRSFIFSTDNGYVSLRTFASYNSELETIMILVLNMSPKFFQLVLLYLVPLHLLDLFSTIVTVQSVSTIYAGRPLNLGMMLLIPKGESRFEGPLVTSLYVLFLNSFIFFGLIWAVGNSFFSSFGNLFMIIYGVGSIVLTVKWVEWSAVWNMSIIFSVLDGKNGLNALRASEYISRGNRARGFQLMLVFFVWRICLRLSCHYVVGQETWFGLVTTSLLSCVGNVMKWVVCTMYFYDCKNRAFEEKVDAEKGVLATDVDTGLTERINA